MGIKSVSKVRRDARTSRRVLPRYSGNKHEGKSKMQQMLTIHRNTEWRESIHVMLVFMMVIAVIGILGINMSSLFGPDKELVRQIRSYENAQHHIVPSQNDSQIRSVNHFIPYVVWMGTIWAGDGFCNEITPLFMTLSEREDKDFALGTAWVAGHSDETYIKNMPKKTRKTMMDAENDFHIHLESNGTIEVAICHTQPYNMFVHLDSPNDCPPTEDTKYVVARSMYESDRIPDDFLTNCNRADEVWVPTSFHKDVFNRSGVTSPIYIVPESVDLDAFDRSRDIPAIKLKGRTFNTVVFVSNFKSEPRKGWKILLEAYFHSFTADDDVILAIKTHKFENFLLTEEVIQNWAHDELGMEKEKLAKVQVFSDHFSSDKIVSFYKAGTAFVLPTRGEGWGLPITEAMSMSLPVIATNWSGPTEFLTSENSYPLHRGRLGRLEGAHQDHLWATPSALTLSKLMRRVFENPEEARAKGVRARQDMEEKFSRDAVSDIIQKNIDRILHEDLPAKEIRQALEFKKKSYHLHDESEYDDGTVTIEKSEYDDGILDYDLDATDDESVASDGKINEQEEESKSEEEGQNEVDSHQNEFK